MSAGTVPARASNAARKTLASSSFFRNYHEGFTLLELLLSIGLFAVGTLAVMGALSIGLFADRELEHHAAAQWLAQTKLEQLKGTAFASIANEAKGTVSGFSFVQREVTVTQPPGTNSNLKQVEVKCYWSSAKGDEQSIRLVTFFVNN